MSFIWKYLHRCFWDFGWIFVDFFITSLVYIITKTTWYFVNFVKIGSVTYSSEVATHMRGYNIFKTTLFWVHGVRFQKLSHCTFLRVILIRRLNRLNMHCIQPWNPNIRNSPRKRRKFSEAVGWVVVGT